MRVVLLVGALSVAFFVGSVSGIQCKFNNGGEFYANKNCSSQKYCIHVDYDGYNYADCGQSELKWVKKAVQMFIGKDDCQGQIGQRGRDTKGRVVGYDCCKMDYCNSASTFSPLFNFAFLALLALFIH